MSHFASILNQFELSFAAISESDLNEFEMRMTQKLHQDNHLATSEQIQLPQDYRQFLIDINGGVSSLCQYKGMYGELDCLDMFFYGYFPTGTDGGRLQNLEFGWLEYDMYREYFDEQIAIPIIELYDFSRALLILTGPEKGAIYEYDSDGEDDDIVVKIANNFTELMEGGDYGEGVYLEEDFVPRRFIQKCSATHNEQALFEYLDSQEFASDELDSMLYESLRLSYFPAVKKLIEIGAPRGDWWSLSWAYTAEIAEFMIQQGLQVNKPSPNGRSPLGWAALQGKLDVVKYLVSQGADIDYINPENGNSIIMEAQASLTELEAEYYCNHTEAIANLKAIIAYLESLGTK